MPKLPIKKTKKLAEAQRLGELEAELKFENKTFTSQKHQWVSLKNHIGKALDRLDPLEAGAIAIATILIKQGVEWTEEVIAQAMNPNSFYRTLLRFSPWVNITELVGTMAGAPIISRETPEGTEAVTRESLDSMPVEVMEWCISFVCAFILVRHADAVLEAGASLLGAAKGLIGGLVG